MDRSEILTQLAASDALSAAIIAATQDPEILYSLVVRPSFTDDSLIVSIGEAQEKVSKLKLECIQSTGQLEEFVKGLLERMRAKWNTKRDYTRLDILNAVHFELLGLLARVTEDSEHVVSVAREALRREFNLSVDAPVAAVTPGRLAFFNRVLEEAIVGLIAKSEAR